MAEQRVWLTWPKARHAAIVAAYPELSGGEVIQDPTPENAAGTHHIISTRRLNASRRASVAGLVGVTVHENWPEGWEPME